MTFIDKVMPLNLDNLGKILTIINSFGWEVYNSKFGFFITDSECKNLKEVMESNYIGLKFMTSKVLKVMKKLKTSDEAKKYTMLYDPKVMVSKDSIDLFTNEKSLIFKNKTEYKVDWNNIELLDLRGKYLC